MRNINDEIARIERSHDNLWSIREDLHQRFDALVKPHLVDSILDCAAIGHEGSIGRFRKIFIEKKAIHELEAIAGVSPDYLMAGIIATRGFTAA